MKNIFNFDISSKGNLCNGTITFQNGIVTKDLQGEKSQFNITEFKEAVLYTNIGCGSLELVPKISESDGSENVKLCSFSMHCVTEMGELVKIINHYIETGETLPLEDSALPLCPKCHRPYESGTDICLHCVKKASLFKRAVGYFKPYCLLVVVAALLMSFSNILSALLPLFNSELIDNYLLPKANAAPYFENRAVGIVALAGAMILVFTFSKLIAIVSGRIANKIGSGFSRDLRSVVYEKIQNLSLTTISGRSAGNLMHRVTKDTEVVKNFLNEQGLYLIKQLITFTVILIILFKTQPLLTLLVIIPVPIGAFLMSLFRNSTNLRYKVQWRINSASTSILHDIIKGIRVVKAFGSEKQEIDKFSEVNKKLSDICASNEKYFAVTYPLVANFIAIGEFFVLFIGGKMVLDGTLTVGELTRFNIYLGFLYGPLKWMSMLPRRFADCTTSLVKIFEILDEEQNKEQPKEYKHIDPSKDIVFNNVTFGYKSYEPVLKNVNLAVKSGEMLGLVGHSGAGKSTIINLCMGLYDADVGSITIGGVDIKDVSPKELRENIGVVFQETYLFSGSIYENIAYARPNASPEAVISAAKNANAHDFIMRLPDGYNTVIGENGHTLSGGERQRISIARAILKNPKILILDEATSSLDPETEIEIQNALGNLIKGRTTIAIAHRLATLKNADRLAVIEKGKVEEEGTHKELIEKNGIYAALVSAQRETQSLK